MANDSVDKCFSSFYNKFNKLVNKHALLRTVSKRKAKQLSRSWISRGLRKSIKIKIMIFSIPVTLPNISCIETKY